MVHADSPEQLPDGWTVQFKVLRTGRKIKCYVHSGTGQKYFSKDDVLRYVKASSTQLDQCQLTNSHIGRVSKDKQMHLIESPEWLPYGWTVELKARKSGFTCGRRYKCYIDPSTGCRFYSKPEVVRYLETMKNKSCMFRQKHIVMTVLPTNKVESEKSTVDDLPTLDDLPPGWIKEIKMRKNANGMKKDPYYTDPVSGYVFRSKRDVKRYLETGEISRHAFLPKKTSIDEETSPSSAAKQKLKHPASGQQIHTGNGNYDVGGIASSEASSLRKSTGSTVTTTTMLPTSLDIPLPSQKSPRHGAMDNGAEYKENCRTKLSTLAKAVVSERNQDKKVSAVGVGQQNSLESGMKRDESCERKTENTSSKSSSKKGLTLPRRSSRRLAGIEPELLDNSVSVVQGKHEADKKQVQNFAGSGINGDEGHRGNTENSLRKSNNKNGLNMPHRSSKQFAGIEPEVLANSVSIVQALPKTTNSNKGGGVLAVGLALDGLADKKSKQIEVEPLAELQHHTSTSVDNPSLGEPSDENQKSDTTSSILAEATVLRSNQCKMVSDDLADKKSKQIHLEPSVELQCRTSTTADDPLLGEPSDKNQKSDTTSSTLTKATVLKRDQCKMVRDDKGIPEADVNEVQNSLESGKEGRGQGKIKNVSCKSSNKKGCNLPRRSSKRLAGLEPELTANSVSTTQALQNAKRSYKSGAMLPVDLDSNRLADEPSQRLDAEPRIEFLHHALSDVNNSFPGEPSIENQVYLHDQYVSNDQSQVLETEKTNKKKSEPQLVPPFGDFWSDPCLEFAFKTLTGEIPIEIAADNELVSTPVADIINERNLPIKRTNKRSNGKTLINSGKGKKVKKLGLPHQSPGQLSKFDCEPTASSVSNKRAKVTARKSSKIGSVVGVNLAPDNVAVGASQQLKFVPQSECALYHSANTSTMLQNDLSSNRIEHYHACTATEEQSQKLEIEKNSNKPEPQPFVSFGDYWSDPCFEFAFKTLTGAIPVEDNMPVQSYFQQQVDTSQTQRESYLQQQADNTQTARDGSLALPDFGLPSFFQTDISVHFDALEKQQPASPPQVPLNNPSFLPSGSVSLPSCSRIGSQQPPHIKERIRDFVGR